MFFARTIRAYYTRQKISSIWDCILTTSVRILINNYVRQKIYYRRPEQ